MGRILMHDRQPPNTCQICIVTLLEFWISHTRIYYHAKPSDSLLHCLNLPVLSSSSLSDHMKNICEHIDIPPSKISPHSLRYGGATMLAAKGFPRYVIEHIGGWTSGSKALDRYVVLTDITRQQMSSAMASGMLGQQSLDSFLVQYSQEQRANHIMSNANVEVVIK